MIATLRQRNFALLWSGGLISQTGDWLLNIGLTVYVYLLTGSALATSIVLITEFVPSVFLGSIAGVFVDRWDRRQTMIVANLLLALGLLPLLFVHDKSLLWVIYSVQFFEACVSQFVLPAESALIPNLVKEDELVPANALKSISMNTSRLAGAALGGLLVGLAGLTSVILLDIVSFLFVCLMIWCIRMPERSIPVPSIEDTSEGASAIITTTTKHLLHEWLEGMQLIYRQRPLLILFIVIAMQGLGEGVFGVLLIVFVKKVLDSGAVAYGLLNSVQAVGSLLGGVIVGPLGKQVPTVYLLGVSCFVFGIIDLLIVDIPLFLPSLLLVAALFVLVGIPAIAMSVGLNALLQSTVEDKLRGRIFGAFLAVQALTVLIGMGLAGALGDRLGVVPMLNIQGSVYVLSGILVIFVLGRTRLLHKDTQEGQVL